VSTYRAVQISGATSGFSDMKSLLSALNQRAPLDLSNNELKAA
jgi:hypothetical protein